MRLIDADALYIDYLRPTTTTGVTCQGYVSQIQINNAPTIEPQRMRGKWIDQKGGGCCCSECGRYALDEPDGNFIHVAVKSNYCPNCGAWMGGQDVSD